MSKVNEENDRASRIGRIQAIVQEDYDRIQGAGNPYVVLNLQANAGSDEVRDRYERYERFYRAENFQRLGDMELTRKALEVRRAIGRAMVTIQTELGARETPAAGTPAIDTRANLPTVSPDARAMADIYFRDGLTYLRLGDFNAACDILQRATGYDPSRGIILANLAYTRFKIDPTSQEIVAETGEHLQRAAVMEPDNPEIFTLLARFGINTENQTMAQKAIATLERLRPDHPRIKRLKKRARVN